MVRRSRIRLVILAMVLAVSLGSCSGDSNEAEAVAELESPDNPANAPIEQIDAGSGGVTEDGPVSGLITVQPSFGFGAYVVDADAGTASAIPGIAAVSSLDRSNDVLVSGNAVFTLGTRVRDGQTFASDYSIVKINYATGRASQLAVLGSDRASDDSDVALTFTIEAVTADEVVTSERNFSSGSMTYRVFDIDTGEEHSSFASLDFSFEYESGSCGGSVGNLLGLSDGTLVGEALESPAVVDPTNGEVALLVPCEQGRAVLGDFISVSEFGDYSVVNEGDVVKTHHVEQLLTTDLGIDDGFVEGDGDLWWLSVTPRAVEDLNVIVGAVVRFDLESASIASVYPLGSALGSYTDCLDGANVCEHTTLSRAQLRFIDDRLVILDRGEDGKVHTLNPADGSLTVTGIAPGVADWTEATMLAGDPEHVWLQVRRMTVLDQGDDGSRTSAAEIFLERLDPETGKIVLTLRADDIFF